MGVAPHVVAGTKSLMAAREAVPSGSRATRRKVGCGVHAAATGWLHELPITHLPSGVDAMRLVERIAFKGVKFPAPLIMLSKVMFTLDGILHDVGGADSGMGFTIARHVARHWLSDRKAFRSPLKTGDWVTLQCSAFLLASRLWLRGEQAILDRVLPVVPRAADARV